MATSQLGQVGELLGTAGTSGAFTARRTATAGDLDIEVKGVGRLKFPISRVQAQRLCSIARPASYGLGEATLRDKGVRNTWEIPKSRVKIDQRRWRRTLLPVLDEMRSALGLPDACRLRAEFHGMLVYAPGQFFLRHKDSEKADGMVGTLVVTLPSSFTGGAMAVEHQGEKVVYRVSRQPLSFISFYADCYHEVRPVRSGYRIVLTYDLVVERDGSAAADTAKPAPAKVAALAALLHQYFETPRPPARYPEKDGAPREPPNRLVYLLDFQYTERGLGWKHLKGTDAARAALLRAAAERAGCELVLALAKVHEVWDCMEDGWDEPWRRRRWSRYESEEEDLDDEGPADDRDGHTLGDLQDASTEGLVRWIDVSGREAEPILTLVAEDEVCCTTPSRDLEPYESQYEGFMGNYGNTMDRWYRRGALVVWPRQRDFAVRAEASPAWALAALQRYLLRDEVDAAREMAASMQSFWTTAAAREEQRGLFDKALRVADGLDAPALAASLLQPFRVEALTPGRAKAFVALVRRYGEAWTRSLLGEWHGERRLWWPGMDERSGLAWRASLPRLCEALRAADDSLGTLAGKLLVQHRWEELKLEIESWRGLERPSERGRATAALSGPILGCLASAAVVQAGDFRDAAVRLLCADENETLLACLVEVLRMAGPTAEPSTRAALGLDEIERHCVRALEARLGQPAREKDDWSIDPPPPGCRCDLCVRLGAFLSDPRERRLEWPLAKQSRGHVHSTIDAHELPVRHETRRSGRPFTLVLEKMSALFEREAAARRSWQADRKWLAKLAGARRS